MTLTPALGTIGWVDLTVEDAGAVRDFYRAVVGWEFAPVEMSGYDDFNMLPAGSTTPAAGICHARGPNAALPPVWMVYITVDDLEASLAAVTAQGGAVVQRHAGAPFAIIRDPAGAVCALYAPPAESDAAQDISD